MPKKIIAVLLSVLVIVTAFALPTFAAEDEVATAAEEDPIQYATNLVPFPYESSLRTYEVGTSVYKNGLTYTFQSDGGIHVSGTTTSGVTLAISDPFDLREGTYTVSGAFLATDALDDIAIIVRKVNASGNNVSWISQGAGGYSTGTLADEESVYYVAVFVGDGKTVDGTIYPMLNMGDFAAPYMLYLPYLLEQQYNNGYANGEAVGNQAGYDQGYTEGESAGIIQGTETGYNSGYQAAVDMIGADVMNPFAAASLTVSVQGAYLPSAWKYEYEVPIVLNADGALSVNACIDYVKTKVLSRYPDTPIENANYTFTFSWLNQSATVGAFDCETSLFAYKGVEGSVTPFMLTGSYKGFFENTDAVVKPSNISIGAGSVLFSIDEKPGFTLSSFEVYYQDWSSNYAADMYLYAVSTVKSPLYNIGYSDGFLEGQKSSLEDAGKVFYDQGYNEGFKYGKQEGLSIADTGDWRNLMLSVVEAPINTFQSLFNFEILGLDMRAAFGSVLAVCVVLFILKKVIF